MRVIKPQFVTPLVSVFDDGKRLHCVITAIFHASFSGELKEERELWSFVNEDVEGLVLDEAKPKTQGEYLVHGSCYARKPDTRQSFVKVAVGGQEKILAVFGKRTFKLGIASTPEPFDVVPIRFTNAFGGDGIKENPTGKGHGGGELPQVEARGSLMKSPSDKPPVVGFGRLDVTWPQRMNRMGTYDEKWRKTRYPGMPEDFDGSYFQLAQPDQWAKGFFAGDETFSAINMHPEHEKVEGKLPGVIARCFVKRAAGDGSPEETTDVAMRIDTVHLFPHRERVAVVCRGTTSTKSDTLSDITEAAFGLEWIGRPKSAAHYDEVFAKRRAKRGGARASLDDTPLLPEADAPPDKERLRAPGDALRKRSIERKLREQFEAMRRQLVEQGVDASHLPQPVEDADLSVDPEELREPEGELPRAEAIEEKIASKKEETLARVRDEAKKAGADMGAVDEMLGKIKKDQVGPPAFSRAKQREQLQDQITLLENAGIDPSHLRKQLDDPALDARLRDLETFVRDSYRKHVQLQGKALPIESDASQILRALVTARVESGESLADVDLTGADLSGLDLRGAKLARAFLESANLTGANLEGADLGFAVLARTRLAGADLRTCKLAGANFSEADLTGTNLGGVDLSGAYFVRADLTRTILAGAKLDRVDFGGAILRRTDLTGSTATLLRLQKLEMEDVSIARAVWERAMVMGCKITGLDATNATLPALAIVDSRLERARFDGAKLPKLRAARIDDRARFVECSFVGALLSKAHLRGAELAACDFRHADFSEADFSEATADDSLFEDARGVGSRFMAASIRRCRFDRADLMDALLADAVMDKASFEQANLYRADLGRSVGEDVNMSGANVRWARSLPKREPA